MRVSLMCLLIGLESLRISRTGREPTSTEVIYKNFILLSIQTFFKIRFCIWIRAKNDVNKYLSTKVEILYMD